MGILPDIFDSNPNINDIINYMHVAYFYGTNNLILPGYLSHYTNNDNDFIQFTYLTPLQGSSNEIKTTTYTAPKNGSLTITKGDYIFL